MRAPSSIDLWRCPTKPAGASQSAHARTALLRQAHDAVAALGLVPWATRFAIWPRSLPPSLAPSLPSSCLPSYYRAPCPCPGSPRGPRHGPRPAASLRGCVCLCVCGVCGVWVFSDLGNTSNFGKASGSGLRCSSSMICFRPSCRFTWHVTRSLKHAVFYPFRKAGNALLSKGRHILLWRRLWFAQSLLSCLPHLTTGASPSSRQHIALPSSSS